MPMFMPCVTRMTHDATPPKPECEPRSAPAPEREPEFPDALYGGLVGAPAGGERIDEMSAYFQASQDRWLGERDVDACEDEDAAGEQDGETAG